jgi:hypothetical protein
MAWVGNLFLSTNTLDVNECDASVLNSMCWRIVEQEYNDHRIQFPLALSPL